MSIEYLPSKIYFFCKDEGTHDGYDNHHQRAESSNEILLVNNMQEILLVNNTSFVHLTAAVASLVVL